ncbi:adenylate cyclase type 2-like isoform X3 [Stegodyphus dumicola]|uniref:adenylate cyclase type 2-like isoform X3 n=1 Tax=Stegodyphus dumicola TaxID=202533 RepID=UPI0015AA8497|nr:adenylate cyclase type 2-like isoform X3 [Stegodyphus dumicola]
MSGLELVARDSASQIEKNAEAAANYFSEVYNRDDDERNWSFSYLKEQLLFKESQQLFRRYQDRVQHALFLELLVFNLVYNALSFLAFTFLPSQEELSEVSRGTVQTGQWCRSTILIVQFCIFVAAYKESLFRNPASKIVVACIVLFCMSLGEMATTIYRLYAGHPESLIRHTYYVVLTTGVLLPFPRKLYSGILAAAVIAVDLMLSSLSSSHKENIITVLCADAVFYATTLSVGLFIRYLIEIMSRRAFLDRRECIESRIKIETEKNQQEKFLQSILPHHIASEVREDIRKVIKNMNRLHMTHKPFNKLYVEKHKDVSVLYADIVNSMLLGASLKVSDLVETLNDLFGRFDYSAENNGCMRIKLLGDCYYCVSGVPYRNPRHADNCVVTGLEMIDIISQVHITKKTRINLLDDGYDIRPGNGHLRDPYLQKEQIETFLIRPFNTGKETSGSHLSTPKADKYSNGIYLQRQTSVTNVRSNIQRLSSRQSSSETILPMSRRGALGYSLLRYRKMVSQVNKILENTIDKMALSKRDQWFSRIGIQPLLLTFREPGTEKPYLNQPDPLFKYYLLCMLFIFGGITVIHLLIMSETVEFWVTYGVALLLILAACIPSWTGYIWLCLKKDDTDPVLNSTALKISRKVWKTTSVRVAIWLAISSTILFCSIAGLNECLDEGIFQISKHHNASMNETSKITHHDLSCQYPWFYTLCAALAMTTTSVFLRIHFLMKLTLNSISLAAFWYIMDIRGEEVFRQRTAKLADWSVEEFGLPADRSHCYYLTFVLLILHVLDRQVEYVCRLDYLMKVKLKAEQEEARTMELVNRMLLFNILPPHVSQYYLSKQLEEENSRVELSYHENHSAVAVLFASIPNFADFYYEDGENEEGLRCIQLLNEIICDFDLLLYERGFHSVEKIKTIGSTYMAACGLRSQEKGSLFTEENPTQNVVTLVKFSVAMMSSLQQLNKDAMQDFQLRVGISVGPVMAGVVGTVKPQYDIWGDTVNVASRMDTTGIPGRIQVVQEVADLITASDCPYKCECRGDIFVKGKGKLKTYLVQTPYDEPNIQDTQL